MASGFTSERRREVVFGLVLLLGVALGGSALEGAFRVFKADDLAQRTDWAEMVEAIGYNDVIAGRPRFRPNSRYRHLVFNSLGMRGPEPVMPTPSDLVRIVFLGDSKVMSAAYAESQTLSAQTVVELGRTMPQCQFDYVTVAGPGYGISFLARLWAEIAPTVQSDLTVVLAGPLTELAQSLPDAAEAMPGSVTQSSSLWPDAFLARSFVLRRIEVRLAAFASSMTPRPDFARSPDALRRTHHANFKPLVDALAETPVLALGYRSRLRLDQDPALQARFAMPLQAALPGMTQADVIAATEQNVEALASLAEEAGWHFADPIARIPPSDVYFTDNTHFSDKGLAELARGIAASIAPLIKSDCTIAR